MLPLLLPLLLLATVGSITGYDFAKSGEPGPPLESSDCTFGFLFITITLLYIAAAAAGGGTMKGECEPLPPFVDTDTMAAVGDCRAIKSLLLHSGTCTLITAVAIAVGLLLLLCAYCGWWLW